MQSLPQIHVIIPVYNCQNYIAETIDSVLNQAYPHLQIILVNDGSSDSSPSICDAYAALHSNIRVIHQKNGGVASARNAALEYLTPPMFPQMHMWLFLTLMISGTPTFLMKARSHYLNKVLI